MTPSLTALIVFALWTIVLLLSIGAVRVGQVLAGKARANDFPGGIKHGGDMYWRLNRAHANCVENLPVFGAIVLAAAASGHVCATFDKLAWAVALARIPQSLAHISSGSELAVNIRFLFFAVQLVSMIAMAVMLLGG